MHEIELADIGKNYENFEVLRRISCDVQPGEFLVLVGPSGCGKSTLLRMIGGLENIDAGELRMEGRRLNEVKARERDMAMVFQNYALYPHLTVAENIGFPLKLRGLSKDKRAEPVARVAKSVGLGHLMERKPAELSGGQRQRVAIGRAIIREPKVFLMDEPLSNLDAKLRVEMRSELRSLHSRLGITTIYVTHDQTEAMTLGSRVAVLRPVYEALRTNLQQIAPPEGLYRHPVNVFVAGFIGSPAMNLILAEVGADRVTFGSSSIALDALAPSHRSRLAHHIGQSVIVGVRPGDFSIDDGGKSVVGHVADVELLGDDVALALQIDAASVPYDWKFEVDQLATLPTKSNIVARLPLSGRQAPGSTISLRVDPEKIMFFNAMTGRNLEQE